MKMKRLFKNISCAVCISLCALMCTCMLSSCAERVKDPVLEYGEHKISLSMYEFMLARMKGTLARNKYDVNPLSDFWSEKHAGTELTNEEYYNSSVLDSCKNYLAALVIFDEAGLKLSDAALAEINEDIDFLIDYDGDGSVEKLDAILNKYGTDTEGLRKIYETEAKYRAVTAYLYGSDASLISNNVKEEYYRENYYRFKQILVSNFYYEYEKDEHGDLIYFDKESGLPLYDSENGVYHYDDNEKRIVDSYDVPIRFDADGNILYDKENGIPAPTTDKKGNAIKHELSKEEMAERAASAKELAELADGGNYSAFESKMPEWQVYEGAGEYYTDGYYLSDIESSAYDDDMIKILAALKEMKEGESRVIEGQNGYHVVVKYELDKGKYADSDYEEWFAAFSDSLITKLFVERCEKMYPDMVVTDIYSSKAKSIKNAGADFDY